MQRSQPGSARIPAGPSTSTDSQGAPSKTTCLTDLAREQLEAARGASSGRASVTVFGGQEHDLRQTVIALAGGRSLGEHESPGDASLQVLVGTVRG